MQVTGSDYNARDGAFGLPVSLPWTAAALAAAALFVALGLWQLERAAEKDRLLGAAAAQAEAAPLTRLPGADALPEELRFARVELRGRYLSGRQFLLDNMTLEGQVGYQVLTPLRLASGEIVLVNRGFLPAAAGAAGTPPAVAVANAQRIVAGRLNELPQPGIRLGANDPGAPGDPWPRVLLYPRAEELRAALGERVPAWQVQLDPDQPDGFVRRWQTVNMGPERHLAYALQWFAFALAVGVIYVVLTWRHARRT